MWIFYTFKYVLRKINGWKRIMLVCSRRKFFFWFKLFPNYLNLAFLLEHCYSSLWSHQFIFIFYKLGLSPFIHFSHNMLPKWFSISVLINTFKHSCLSWFDRAVNWIPGEWLLMLYKYVCRMLFVVFCTMCIFSNHFLA